MRAYFPIADDQGAARLSDLMTRARISNSPQISVSRSMLITHVTQRRDVVRFSRQALLTAVCLFQQFHSLVVAVFFT